MGRSRGGLTTKIHALVDAQGRPIHLKLTEGQAHDGRSAADMFETLGSGDILLAGRAYDSGGLRETMSAPGVRANIRAMPNRVKTYPFSDWVYRLRNLAESVRPTLSNRWRSRPHSTNSNTTVRWQPDTTNETTTTSHPSNSPQSASGCDLRSR